MQPELYAEPCSAAWLQMDVSHSIKTRPFQVTKIQSHALHWFRERCSAKRWKKSPPIQRPSKMTTLGWEEGCEASLWPSLEEKTFTVHCEEQRNTYVDGAAQQGAPLQCLADDVAHVARCPLEVIHLCYAASEILKALSGAAPRQRLVAAVQPEHRAARVEREVTRAHRAAALPHPLAILCPPVVGLTWHRPSPAERSRTPCTLLNAQTGAPHPWWAAGRPPPRPPTHQTARSRGKKG